MPALALLIAGTVAIVTWFVVTGEMAGLRLRYDLATAKRRRTWAISSADKAVSKEEDRRRRRIQEAETKLRDLESGRGPVVAFLGGIEVRRGWIRTPGGSGCIGEVDVAADSSGGKYFTERRTITRMSAGALVAGPAGLVLGSAIKKKKHKDDSEHLVAISHPDFSHVASVGSAVQAQRLAAEIRSAAIGYAKFQAALPKLTASARTEVAVARDDTTSVDAARAALAETAADQALAVSITAAQSRLDAWRLEQADRRVARTSGDHLETATWIGATSLLSLATMMLMVRPSDPIDPPPRSETATTAASNPTGSVASSTNAASSNQSSAARQCDISLTGSQSLSLHGFPETIESGECTYWVGPIERWENGPGQCQQVMQALRALDPDVWQVKMKTADGLTLARCR